LNVSVWLGAAPFVRTGITAAADAGDEYGKDVVREVVAVAQPVSSCKHVSISSKKRKQRKKGRKDSKRRIAHGRRSNSFVSPAQHDARDVRVIPSGGARMPTMGTSG
jgi:hypothetical protein